MKNLFLPAFLLTFAGFASQAQISDNLLFEQIDMTENYRIDIPEQDRFDDRTYYQTSTVSWQWPVSYKGKTPVNLQRTILENDSALTDIRENLRSSMRKSAFSDNSRLVPVKAVPENMDIVVMEDQSYLHVEYVNQRIAVLRQQTYIYSGGAHGNHGTLYICYDLQEDKEIAFDDIIGDERGVENLILKKLMQRYGCNSVDKLSEHLFLINFEAGNNIRIDEKGITFVYNPYEIGPYSEGVIEVTLKADEVRPMLTDYGKQILP